MSSPAESLASHRRQASELSGGTSGNAIYETIEKLIIQQGFRGAVLDYGAGVAELTRRLSHLNLFNRLSAADLMSCPGDLQGKVEWIEQDLNTAILNHENSFDLVVAAEVIEHLENPRFMIREIFRLLRPGGTMILSTPNNESWRAILALIVRGHFVAFTDSCYPAHITALVRKDFIRICSEVRFDVPQFYFTNNGGIPGHPSLTWQTLSLGLLRGRRFSDNVIAMARKAD